LHENHKQIVSPPIGKPHEPHARLEHRAARHAEYIDHLERKVVLISGVALAPAPRADTWRIRAVHPDGTNDCPLAKRIPSALWPGQYTRWLEQASKGRWRRENAVARALARPALESL
jgi:hypothetical protein